MTRSVDPAWTLAAGALLAASAMLLTHPLAVVGVLSLSILFAWIVGAFERTRWIWRAAIGLGLAVLVFNGLFSWNGASLLWAAPFRIDWLGRPRITVEAIVWGAIAGAQLASTVLALGAATLSVPPETLHRALERVGLPRSVATAAGLALRLVPDTTRDAQAMRQALRVRGVRTDGLRGASHVLVPLTARALDRAQLSEQALVMRGYDPQSDRREQGRWPAPAWFGLAGIGVALAAVVIGPGRPAYYPTLAASMGPVTLGWVLASLLLPSLLVAGVIRSSS